MEEVFEDGETLEQLSAFVYAGRFFHVVKSISKLDKIVKLIKKNTKGLLNFSHKQNFVHLSLKRAGFAPQKALAIFRRG